MCDKIIAPDPQEKEECWASRYVDKNTGEVIIEFDAKNNIIYQAPGFSQVQIFHMLVDGLCYLVIPTTVS